MTINEEQTLSPPHAQISDQVGTDGIDILSMTKITASNPDFKNVLKNHMCVSFTTRHVWNDGNSKPSFSKPTYTQLMTWDKYLKENRCQIVETC